MELSQILIWITVGFLLAIGAAFVFVKIRNFRRRFETKHYPPVFSVETAMNEQNAFISREMKTQADNAADVKTALAEQQTEVKDALEKQQTEIKDALTEQQTDVKTALAGQQTDVKDALTQQQETVRQGFDAQSENIETALENYQSAKKSDLEKETEIVKTALADTVKTGTNRTGEEKVNETHR